MGIDEHGELDTPFLIDITLPDGVEVIAYQAFNGTHFRSLYIPNSVTYIANYAFDEVSIYKIEFETGGTLTFGDPIFYDTFVGIFINGDSSFDPEDYRSGGGY